MKLISGELGGRKLKTAMENSLRPAMGKTREALFSLLEANGIDWGSISVLDLFAGCGSLGLECISRGARRADFVENALKQYEVIRENAKNLGVSNRCGVYRQDVIRFLRHMPIKLYDIIFLDPPYGKNFVKKSLENLLSYGWMQNNPVIIAEVEKYIAPEMPGSFAEPMKRIFGQTTVYIWNLP